MVANVFGISTSPRRKGNSDLLLREALTGAESAGAKIEYVRLADYKVGPCIECNACFKTGECAVKDDYQQLLEKILKADGLIFATPIFFMGVCAQAKNLIDRGQCLWAAKYILKREIVPSGSARRGMVIAVGGSKSKKQFECVRLTMVSYFDSLQISYASNLFVGQVDSLGDIKKHTSALQEAHKLGSELVTVETPPLKPVNVELF